MMIPSLLRLKVAVSTPASAAPQSMLGQFASARGPKQPAHLVALEKTQAARALRSNRGARQLL